MSHTELLPPSMFQSVKPPDPWQGLAKVSEEILQLRRETQNLRYQEHQASPVVQTQVPIQTREQGEPCFHRHAGTDEFKYANELISRQTKEILELKNEIQYITDEHKREARQVEEQLFEKERKYTSKITSLENMLQHKEENYDQEVGRLSFEHQKTTEEMSESIERMTEELNELKTKRKEREEDLTQRLKSSEEEKSSSVHNLQYDLREQQKENESLVKQVQQLKSYIGETEKSHRPMEVWRKENDTLSNKLQLSEVDRENLKSTLELSNVRLSSMGEILSVQEAEISKSKMDIIENKNLKTLLLTRWREKVFALMVQNKSSEIYVKQNMESWKGKYLSLQEELQSANRQIEILKHQQAEKIALIELEKINSKKAIEELSQTQQVAITLDNQVTDNSKNLHLMQTVAQAVDKRVADTMKKISSSLSKLKSHGERISFASSRVALLQGQFARKDAMLQLEKKDEIQGLDEEEETKDHIIVELDKVTKERDFVTNQLKEVSDTLNDKIQENRQQYEDEIHSLKRTVEDLEIQLQNKSQAVVTISEQLEVRELESEETNERVEVLSKELGKQKTILDQAVEDQKLADEETMRKQMVELEKQVNLARREQTKAVVSLRQLERASLREKERMSEQIKLTESHYDKQIKRLQEQLKTTEKERNIMMATLRQEGLMSKIKQDRGQPIRLEDDKLNQEEPLKSQERVEDESQVKNTQSKPEDMCDVIEDLKSLAAIIVEDSSGESDDGLTS